MSDRSAAFPFMSNVMFVLTGSVGIALLLFIIAVLLPAIGIVYDIPRLIAAGAIVEQAGGILLALAILTGGSIGLISMTVDCFGNSALEFVVGGKRKRKPSNRRAQRRAVCVDQLLSTWSHAELELLRLKLVESRLAIRYDGVLIPMAQAQQLRDIERYNKV